MSIETAAPLFTWFVFVYFASLGILFWLIPEFIRQHKKYHGKERRYGGYDGSLFTKLMNGGKR